MLSIEITMLKDFGIKNEEENKIIPNRTIKHQQKLTVIDYVNVLFLESQASR